MIYLISPNTTQFEKKGDINVILSDDADTPLVITLLKSKS